MDPDPHHHHNHHTNRERNTKIFLLLLYIGNTCLNVCIIKIFEQIINVFQFHTALFSCRDDRPLEPGSALSNYGGRTSRQPTFHRLFLFIFFSCVHDGFSTLCTSHVGAGIFIFALLPKMFMSVLCVRKIGRPSVLVETEGRLKVHFLPKPHSKYNAHRHIETHGASPLCRREMNCAGCTSNACWRWPVWLDETGPSSDSPCSWYCRLAAAAASWASTV